MRHSIKPSAPAISPESRKIPSSATKNTQSIAAAQATGKIISARASNTPAARRRSTPSFNTPTRGSALS
ncbi:MAG TPA: hypothetical protein DEW22_05975 [Clostridiales bacterium]|nr:hypothetical protein [Clostridiales bacterium]